MKSKPTDQERLEATRWYVSKQPWCPDDFEERVENAIQAQELASENVAATVEPITVE